MNEKYWHFHKSGRRAGNPLARCRDCQNWAKLKEPGQSGWVPAIRLLDLVNELIGRVGISEAARRMNGNPNTLRDIRDGYTTRIQKRTAHRLILAVAECRKKGEMIHKASVKHGSLARGKHPRKVKRISEQSGPVYPDLEREIRKRERESWQKSRLEGVERQERHEEELNEMAGY